MKRLILCPQAHRPWQNEKMKAFRLSLKIIFTIFLFRLLTSGVYAQSDSYAVESLCEYAKALYEQGDTEEAKHEFSKVLIIDPDKVGMLAAEGKKLQHEGRIIVPTNRAPFEMLFVDQKGI